VEELPHKLKIELSMVIHSKMYQNIKFFKGKDSSFLVWVAMLLKPLSVESEEYIFKEGEDLVESNLRSYFNFYSFLFGERLSWICFTKNLESSLF